MSTTEDISGYFKSIAEKSVRYQVYIMRRSWGVYYAIWAIAFIIFSMSPPFIFGTFRGLALIIIYVACYGLTWYTAGYFTYRIFSKNKKINELKKIIGMKTNLSKRLLRPYLFGILISFVLILVAGILSGIWWESILFLILMYISYLILRNLSNSFEKIPMEGYVALIFFIGSTVASTSLPIILRGSYLGYYLSSVSWVPAIVAWLFASFYALYSAPLEMAGID